MLVQVTAPHFCAGIVIENGKSVKAAPILAWTLGKDWGYLQRYFERKNWKWIF